MSRRHVIMAFWMGALMFSGGAEAGTLITFDDLPGENPSYYRTPDGLYDIRAFGADVNLVDTVHGNPPPSMGIPVPYSTQTLADAGINLQSSTLHQEFQWDELTIFGHPTHGAEYWIHAVDSDMRDIFVLHGIVYGAQVVQTPKSDAEIMQLWVLMLPIDFFPNQIKRTDLGLYGAVDNIKLRAKGEKLPKVPEKCKRKCGQ